MKKIICTLLSMLILITSSITYNVMAETVPSKSYSKIIADNYSSLTNDEKFLLNSGLLDLEEEIIEYQYPSNEDIFVNPETKIISLENKNPWIVDDTANISWSSNPNGEDIVIVNGVGNFSNVECGNQYTVSAKYILNTEIDADIQKRLLNIGYYLKDGYDRLEGVATNVILGQINTLEENREKLGYDESNNHFQENIDKLIALKGDILAYMQKNNSIAEYLMGEDGIKFSTDARNAALAISDLFYEFNKVKQLIINWKILGENTADLVDSISKAAYGLVKNLLVGLKYETEDNLDKIIYEDDAFDEVYIENLENKVNSEIWSIHNYDKDVIRNFDGLDNLIKNKEFNLHQENEILVTLKVDEKEVKSQTNQFVVSIKVNGTIIKNNVEESLEEKEFDLIMPKNTSADEINEDVKNGNYVEFAIDSWGIDDIHYDINYNDLQSPLTSDTTYNIVIKPKKYDVTKWGNNTELPYGYVLILPTYESEWEDASLEYDYMVNGNYMQEGSNVEIIGNTEITRTYGKAYSLYSIGDVVSQSSNADELTTSILTNKALLFPYLQLRTPDNTDNLLSIEGDYLKAKNYLARKDSNGNEYYWVAVSAIAKNGSTETNLTIEDGDENCKQFNINEVSYQNIEVKYELEVSEDVITLADAQKALNLAKDLVDQGKKQLKLMNDLKNQRSNIDKADEYIPTLVTMQNSLFENIKDRKPEEIAAVNAVNDIYTRCYDAVNEKSLISKELDKYNSLTSDAERLVFIYENYDFIASQINILADDLALIIAVPTLYTLLEQNGFGEYCDQIQDVSDGMNDIKQQVQEAKPNTMIDIESNYLDSLSVLIAKGISEGINYSIINEVALSKELDIAAAGYITLKFGVRVIDNLGKEIGTYYSNIVLDNPDGSIALSQDYIDNTLSQEFESLVKNNVDNVSDIKKLHYELVSELPTAQTYTNSSELIVTYAPKKYKVNFKENESVVSSVEFKYVDADNRMTIELPHDSENIYTFIIDGKNYTDITSYTFKKSQINSLFYDVQNNQIEYNIKYTKSSKAKNDILTIIDNLNNSMQNFCKTYSYNHAVSNGTVQSLQKYGYIPLENENGDIDTLVIRLTFDDVVVGDLLSGFVLGMGQSAAEISFGVYNEDTGDYDFELFNNKETKELNIQSVLNMILSCGFNLDDADLILQKNPDGSYTKEKGYEVVNETFKDSDLKVSYHNNYVNYGNQTFIKVNNSLLETTELGNRILESKIRFNVNGTIYEYNLAFTIETFGMKTDLADVIETVLDLRKTFQLDLARDGINLTTDAGQSFYDLGLAALVLLNQTSFEEISNINPEKVGDYLISKIYSLFNEKDEEGNYTLTLELVKELLNELDVEVPESIDTIYKIAAMFMRNAKFVYEDEKPSKINGEDVNIDHLYQTKLVFILQELFEDDVLDLPIEVLNSLTEEERENGISAYLRLNYIPLNTDYKLFAIDYNAFDGNNIDSIKKTIKFYKTAKEINVNHENTYIILLKDIDGTDTLTLNNNTILDLNGHSIKNKLVVNSNELRIVDSKFSKTNYIEEINTNKTKIHVGCSSIKKLNGSQFTEDNLEPSYIIKDGRIVNQYYSINADENVNNIRVNLDLNEIGKIQSKDDIAYLDLAYEIAFEVALNVYKNCAMDINGMNIYSLTIDDLVNIYSEKLDAFEIDDINNWINVYNIVELTEDIINEIFNFDNLNRRINDNGKVYQAQFDVKGWDFEFTAKNHNLTANIITAEDIKTTKVSFYVEVEDKLRNIIKELADVTDLELYLSTDEEGILEDGNKAGKLNIRIDYNNEEKSQGIFDFTKSSTYSYADYTVGLLTIIGGSNSYKNTEKKNAIKAAIIDYYETGNINGLYDCVNNITTNEAAKAFNEYSSRNSFDKYLNNLGVNVSENVKKVVDLYDEIFFGGSYALENDMGDSNKLSRWSTGYGTYRVHGEGNTSKSYTYEGYKGTILLDYEGVIDVKLLPDTYNIDTKFEDKYLYRGDQLSDAILKCPNNGVVYINKSSSLNKNIEINNNVELEFAEKQTLLFNDNNFTITIDDNEVNLVSNVRIDIRNFKTNNEQYYVVEKYDEETKLFTYYLGKNVVVIKNSSSEIIKNISDEELINNEFTANMFDTYVKSNGTSINFYGYSIIKDIDVTVDGIDGEYTIYINNSHMIDQPIIDDKMCSIIMTDINETLVIEGSKWLKVTTPLQGCKVAETQEFLGDGIIKYSYKIVSEKPVWNNSITAVTGDKISGYLVDEENKYIYIDVISKGITQDDFKDLVTITANNPITNTPLNGIDGDYEWSFDKCLKSFIEPELESLVGTGDIVTIKAYMNIEGGTKNYNDVTKEYSIIVMGDMDHDGRNNSTDSNAIEQYYLKYEQYAKEGNRNSRENSHSLLSLLAANIDQSIDITDGKDYLNSNDAKIIQDKYYYFDNDFTYSNDDYIFKYKSSLKANN